MSANFGANTVRVCCHELSQSRHLGGTRAQRWPVRLDCPKYKNLKLRKERRRVKQLEELLLRTLVVTC